MTGKRLEGFDMPEDYIRLDKYLLKYCPVLVDFVSLPERKWDVLSRRFGQRMNKINIGVSEQGALVAETTLHDLIVQAEADIAIAKNFLLFIDNVFKDVLKFVPAHHHAKLRQAARNLLSNFDIQRSAYLDPLGELKALLSLLKNSDYKLIEIEFKLSNGKSADYYLIHPSGHKILIDVLNIHFKDGRIRNEVDLLSFLSKRIQDKLGEKTSGVDFMQLGKQFKLLPVVWCDFKDVHEYTAAFDTVEANFGTLPFCVMGQTSMGDGSYTFHFSTVKRLIEAYQKQINYGSGA